LRVICERRLRWRIIGKARYRSKTIGYVGMGRDHDTENLENNDTAVFSSGILSI